MGGQGIMGRGVRSKNGGGWVIQSKVILVQQNVFNKTFDQYFKNTH